MEKYLKRMFSVVDGKVDTSCRIKNLVGKAGLAAMSKTMSENYSQIIKEYKNKEKLFDQLKSVERLWQAESMLESAVVGPSDCLPQTMWLLEKILLAQDYGAALNAKKANELIKGMNKKQQDALVWSYIWHESNSLKNRSVIEEFISEAKEIRKTWSFSPFISEDDYELFSRFGSTTNRALKNPSKPTLTDMIVAPVMNGQAKDYFDVAGFFKAFPEFKTLERNPAWGHYGGYALESISQIMYGPIELAAQCLMATK